MKIDLGGNPERTNLLKKCAQEYIIKLKGYKLISVKKKLFNGE